VTESQVNGAMHDVQTTGLDALMIPPVYSQLLHLKLVGVVKVLQAVQAVTSLRVEN